MFFKPSATQVLAGGKFNGLVKLQEAGLNVPPFFGWKPEFESNHQIDEWLSTMPQAPLAVRSSGLDEDGTAFSYAGQYHSILRVVPNSKAVREAADRINAEANNSRVQHYANHAGVNPLEQGNLPLVIQTMVEPAWSGVLFTADPVSGFQDRMLISCVAGDAEDLVGGAVNGFTATLPRWGANQGLPLGGHNLPNDFLPFVQELYKGACKAEKYHGNPVDLEWAIDTKGDLFWLQMRPITTLGRANPHELDSHLSDLDSHNDIFTLGNIGEMMPGAVTPLTAEVFGGSIDAGLIDFASRSGVPRPSKITGGRYVQTYYYRLFFNLSNLYDFCRYTSLNHRENIELSIVGRSLDQEPIPLQVNKFKAILNFLGQVRYLLSANSRLKQLEQMCAQPEPVWSDDATILIKQLAEARLAMDLGFCHHFATSSSSGSNYTALVRTIMAQLKLERQMAQGLANTWLTGIGSIESADPLVKLEHLAGLIKSFLALSNPNQMSAHDFLLWINHQAPAKVKSAWNDFILRHGHRGIREAELSTPAWEHDKELLAQLLLQLMAIPEKANFETEGQTQGLKEGFFVQKPTGLLLTYFLKQARNSVIKREKSKALSIKLLSRLKKGYRTWGKWACKIGILEKEEDVFFLLTNEIEEASRSRLDLKLKVQGRRASYELCRELHFNDLMHGKPFPIFQQKSNSSNENEWQGVPVSPGMATGIVKVVKTTSDAANLEPDNILVSSFTDIGWTPYYSVVKGLLTEMGSPLSHGAVVAREYGLPAVVGVPGICSELKDGDRIELNGLLGLVRRL